MPSFKSGLRAGIAALGLATVLAAGQAQAREYTVLVVQSLTGALGFVGGPIKDGMVLAAEQINASHFLGEGNTIKTIVEDDATDRAQATTLVNRYAANPDVIAILGPTTTTVAIPAAQAANDHKIVALVTTNSDEIPKTGPYAFRLSQAPDVVIPYIARYAVDKQHVQRCVIIGLIDSEAYVAQSRQFAQIVTERGAKIIDQEGIKIGDTNFSALASKIADLKPAPDCIYYSTTAPIAANLSIQLREAGLDPSTKLFGHSGLNSPDLPKAGGKAVEGLFLIGDWVPGGATPQAKAFAAAYEKRYGQQPDNWGPLGYTGMYVLATAINNAGPNPTRDSVRDAMAKTKDVPSIIGDGKYSYDENRGPHSGMNVLMVQNGKFVLAP